MPKITPNLWFDTQAEEAANFYVSIFENSEIRHVARYGEAGPGPEGTVVTVEFRLDGQEVLAINGGPEFTFSEAVSFAIDCATQDEVDYYWEKLTEGGSPGPCGWLKDKYGFSWQVVPSMLGDLMRTGDPEKVNRMTKAMFQMSKLDIAQLQGAYDQE
ncbi:MAG: VOC family protein [Thermomicrobiales bacterium]